MTLGSPEILLGRPSLLCLLHLNDFSPSYLMGTQQATLHYKPAQDYNLNCTSHFPSVPRCVQLLKLSIILRPLGTCKETHEPQPTADTASESCQTFPYLV